MYSGGTQPPEESEDRRTDLFWETEEAPDVPVKVEGITVPTRTAGETTVLVRVVVEGAVPVGPTAEGPDSSGLVVEVSVLDGPAVDLEVKGDTGDRSGVVRPRSDPSGGCGGRGPTRLRRGPSSRRRRGHVGGVP